MDIAIKIFLMVIALSILFSIISGYIMLSFFAIFAYKRNWNPYLEKAFPFLLVFGLIVILYGSYALMKYIYEQ